VNIEQLAEVVGILQDRQSIYDCLIRYSRGVDRLDRDLLLSVYHPDAIDDHGTFYGSPADFADYVIDMHTANHFSHQHCLYNHSCDLDGNVAHAETYYTFVCMNRIGKPVTMNGGRYIDRFERRENRWAIAHRVCVRDWALLDEHPDPDDLAAYTARRAVLAPEVVAFMNAGARPARDRSDPSYQRPLQPDPQRACDWAAFH
jgi:hypothetical protein